MLQVQYVIYKIVFFLGFNGEGNNGIQLKYCSSNIGTSKRSFVPLFVGSKSFYNYQDMLFGSTGSPVPSNSFICHICHYLWDALGQVQQLTAVSIYIYIFNLIYKPNYPFCQLPLLYLQCRNFVRKICTTLRHGFVKHLVCIHYNVIILV